MKINASMLALIALASTQAQAKTVVSAPMEPMCIATLQTALAVLGGAGIDDNGKTTIDQKDAAAYKVSNVKTIDSACYGPSDCDDKNPDAFTWSADLGEKGDLHGQVVVHYHRGNCTIQKLALINK